RAAFDAFTAQSIPTLKHEDWRYTDLRELNKTDYAPAEPNADVTTDDIAPFLIPNLDTHLLVFVDGHWREDLSAIDEHPEGTAIGTLAQAYTRNPAGIADYLGKQVDLETDAMSALNTALMEDGAVIYLKPGKTIDKPIHVLSVATAKAAGTMTHPRNLIVAGEDASVTVLEHYVTLGGENYFNNAVTELFAADRAEVHHYLLEREAESAVNISTLEIHQGEKSDVHSHTVLLGGKLVRNNVRPTMAGEDGHCLINGLFVGHGDQTLDNAMRVEHNAPNCRSRQFYKGIMSDKSHGVFTGRIVVAEEGQQTDAIQSNRNMLLSDDARMNARPQLEIYADDVRCTHGATTGQVDPEAVFYFRARGLPEDVARAMLIYAFAAEGFDRMQLVPVRALLADEMIAKLPMANKLSAEFNEEIKERLYRI
ncbi:MAG: Fe-S cluster assembly protein SufD, partial [Desulfobacterales bacterium]|nr:Fe-S cluster assembly protein SufD [Desulfobacterales bacterium]